MDSLLAMGFAEYQVKKAMQECGGNAEAAANYIMGHLDEPEEFWFTAPVASTAPAGREYHPEDAGEHAAVLAPLIGMATVPTDSDFVSKEECAWSFARPTSPEGLYVSLRSFMGVGHKYLDFHRKKTGDQLYLNITSRLRSPAEQAPGDPGPVKSVAEAINKAATAKEFDTVYKLVAITDHAGTKMEIPLEVDLEAEINPAVVTVLPGSIAKAIDGVLKAKDRGAAADLAEFKDEIKETQFHAAIVPENNGKKLSPNKEDWKCDKTGETIGDGPGQTASLWLNLSDGFVGGGRKNWDGSGGNHTAIEHFEDLKKQGKLYPLAVKLGTITPEGADIFSYEEDESVSMPKERLAELLAHWGVDVMTSVKTEKDMQEMQMELNFSYDFSRITGDGAGEPVHGPGRTGLINMGNSCYMNSVLQILCAIPEFQHRYADRATEIFDACGTQPLRDFHTQFAKLVAGLCSGQYAPPPAAAAAPGSVADGGGNSDERGVRPKAFKMLVGEGHAEFSSAKQQDAQEYFLYLLMKIERAERAVSEQGAAGGDPSGLFEFSLEERFDAGEQGVLYKTVPSQNCLSLIIPIEAALNTAEVAQYTAAKQAAAAANEKFDAPAVILDVPFAATMERWKSNELVTLRGNAATSKTQRFSSFPAVLAIHVRREVVEAGSWVPKKLEVALRMPETLDLSSLRGGGLQPSETAMVDEPDVAAGGSESGVEGALAPVPEEALMMLISMGFPQEKCEAALRATGNDTERATEWIFSHLDDDAGGGGAAEGVGAASEGRAATEAAAPRGTDGPGRYELLGFISHIGKNVTSGHYVCHIKKDEEWLIFNDEKVERCADPPLECGYLYFYRRRTVAASGD